MNNLKKLRQMKKNEKEIGDMSRQVRPSIENPC